MADGECVKVIVRCRPMNDREKGLNCNTIISMVASKGQCTIKNPSDAKAPPKLFTFDGAYFTDSTTESIYNEIAYPLVEGVTEGYNGTIFAYGQTGCGKSFTMQGITNPQSQRGIIPRAFDHIFETVSVVDGTKFLLHASYCEIYNEEIRDLLGKDAKAKLDLKEHPEKGVYVNGLSMHPVHKVAECEKIMDRGWKNRSTGATLMNADSSRSHSIFTVSLEMITTDDKGEEHIRAGKLNLVDLAGSERQAKTGATGDRLKEATKINLSLSALGNVISALVDGKSKHIPYRDSKLTRLLQDSLGGNTKTLMAACLSPADNNYEETLSTLRYANRAKNIQNKPKINEDPKDALLREYQEEIQKLKAMLMGQLPIPEGGFDNVQGGAPVQVEGQLSRQDLEEEKQRIREEYDAKMTEMQQEFEKEKMSKAKLEQNLIKLRTFYDNKLSSVDGQIKDLPPTAAVLGEIDWEDGDIQFGDVNRGGEMIDRDGEELLMEMNGHESRGQIQGQEGEDDESETDDRVGAAVVAAGAATGVKVKKGKQAKQSKRSEADESTGGQQEDDGITADHQARPGSVAGAAMPPGPTADAILTDNATASENGVTPRTTEAAMIGRRGREQEGLVAPSSSPTQSNMQEQLKLNQEEARRRIQELEQQMVGGEMKDNKEVKERRKKRKKFADERKQKLMEAVANMDDDYIMLEIYDNMGDEVKAKTELLNKEKDKVEILNREILDIRSEFEFERIDMLDTIRKQNKELSLLQGLLDKIHPCLRRDCNYSNLDKIKLECKWDDDEQRWLMPRMMISTTALPVAEAVMPGTRGIDAKGRPRPSPILNGDVHASTYDNEEDRFKDKLMRKDDKSDNYFKPKRASQLLGSTPEPAKINMAEIKDTMKKSNNVAATNGYGNHEDGMSSGLRAAAVHGQLLQDDNMIRRPTRLEALPQSTGGKKLKRKKNALDPL